MVRIGTLNVHSGRNANLDCALRGSHILGIDIIVLTETKIDDEKYTRYSHAYEIHATKAVSKSQGGVALAIRKDRGKEWDVEDLSVNSANVIGCTLVSGPIRKRLIGVYLLPSEFTGTTIDVLAQAVEAAKDPCMVLGDFNANLGELAEVQRRGPLASKGERAERRQVEVLATIASLGLSDTAKAFRQRKRTGTWTWGMSRKESRVRSTVDYVLVKGHQLVQCHRVRGVAYVSTDHRMVYVERDLAPGDTRVQRKYVEQLQTFPVPLPMGDAMSDADKLFQVCLDERRPPEKQKGEQDRPSWILDKTWAMIRRKAELRRSRGQRLRG
jgi:exonuclease III